MSEPVRSLAERAVATSFLAKCTSSAEMRRRADGLAAIALERFDDEELSPGLHGGSIGIAWCLQHVLAGRAEEVLAEVDDAICDTLSGAEEWPDYGILRGLAGVGLYALERRSERLVRGVVDALDWMAVSDGCGRTFHTSAVHTHHPDYFPRGHFNLGLGHGIAGALCFLVHAYTRYPSATAEGLIDDVVGWLLARERPDGYSAFPAILVPGGEELESDAGWAHGDAGVGYAILMAGLRRGRPEWAARGERIARRSLRRPLATYVQAYESTITHGSAGMALLYGRLERVTADARYGDGAHLWLRRMDERSDEPIANTLASGTIGNALVRMTFHYGVEPTWAACLGLA